MPPLCSCASSSLYVYTAERHGVTVYCVVCMCVDASEVLSFLTCSTLIKALAILSWLPLITNTAWLLPGLLCFPQSHWRTTGECLLLRLRGYQAEAILAGQTSNVFFFFFSFAYLPTGKNWEKKMITKLLSLCQVHLSFKCLSLHTVNACSPSSLFYCFKCSECYWCAGRVVIDGLTGMHNITWGKAHSTFLPFSRHHQEWLWIHLNSIINITSLK